MPTYEYGCQSCGHQWELEQRISAPAIKQCPQCQKDEAKRLISGGNFILKGSGWYADLYHKPAAAKSSSGESSSSATTSESSSTSSSSDSSSTKAEPAKSDSSKAKKAANE